MRRVIRLVVLPAVGLWVVFATHQVWGFPAVAVKTGAACAACHVNPAGGAELTAAGKTYAEKSEAEVSKDAAKAEYVSSAKCRTCHLKQYKAWQQTPHAHAYEGLDKASPEAAAAMAKALEMELTEAPIKTDGCVKCHVTGMGLSGGYPAADSTKNANLSNVTCEACHGPGSLHIAAKAEMRKSTINKAVSAKMCTQCHTSATSPKFDFATYKAKGVHQVAAAK